MGLWVMPHPAGSCWIYATEQYIRVMLHVFAVKLVPSVHVTSIKTIE